MKWKTKKKIAYEIAKEFWNNSNERLRTKMMRDYIEYINCILDEPYKLDNYDYLKLAECDWKGIPLYNEYKPGCYAEPSDLRTSVCYYLGIGLYEGKKRSDYLSSADPLSFKFAGQSPRQI